MTELTLLTFTIDRMINNPGPHTQVCSYDG
jgi:hypothetical protein